MNVALVTGAGGGIGRSVALALAAEGLAVAVDDLDVDAARAVADEVVAAGGVAVPYGVSVLDFDAARGMVAGVEADLGPVDVLVSGVSVAGRGKSLLFTEVDEIEALFRMNVLATVVLCQAVLPGMRERHQGAIVVVSSIAPQAMDAKAGSYNIAKAGLEVVAYTLAKEEAKHGVRVNVVAPGETDTPLGRQVRARIVEARTGREATDEELREGMASPEAVADAVRFLVSPAAAQVTGQRINVVGSPAAVFTPRL